LTSAHIHSGGNPEDICEIAQLIQDTRGYIVIGSYAPIPIGYVFCGLMHPTGDRVDCTVAVIGQTDEQDWIEQLKVVSDYPSTARYPYYVRAKAE